MNFRNSELLGKLQDHPLRKMLAQCLDISEAFRGDVEFLKLNKDLSTQGRQKALQANLRKAVRDLRDVKGPLTEMQQKLEAKRAAVKAPAFDKTDLVGGFLRQELRATMRALPADQRALLLTGPNSDQTFVDAMLETAPLVSGLGANETFIVDAAKEQRLETLFGPQLAEIKQLEETIGEAAGIVALARVDLQGASEMDGRVFESFVKPIETKASAPWLIRRNETDPVVVINPAKHGTTEFQRLANPDEIRDGKFYANEAEYLADRAAA